MARKERENEKTRENRGHFDERRTLNYGQRAPFLYGSDVIILTSVLVLSNYDI